ncbi:acyltransferase family protein [Gilvimarinus algae]|uniref:Acyltransferase family protein n=1 Tax=Gilvimarinus algae TaxID=3058037 RepID=A0ABT8TJ06_9GAMM|nr:acyltransferase family protein [Gilvimarinus sp. SDUM040014]MDO3383333.1 acyltransferase family protein [Gilvimarinus sp. SDUM040014]
MNASSERLHYMDNLRAIVMIVGVFFHAALAYSPQLHPVWMSADTVNSPLVDWVASFLHVFRMPLFFVVAGFFGALLVRQRGVGAMLKNRALRVLLPFVIFWPLVMAAIIAPMMWAVHNVENLPPLLEFIQSMMANPDAPQSPPSTVHLWFLYYLAFFYVLIWVLRQAPLGGVKRFLLDLHPMVALMVLPLCLIPGLSLAVVPYPAPESFIPQLWAFGFFGLFFVYGYWLFDSMRLLDYFERYGWALVAMSVLLFIPLFYAFPETVTLQNAYVHPPWPERALMVICIAYISVFMSVACLVLARVWLNQRNAFMRYMSDASYWIYIAHLPVVLAIQYWLLDQPGGWFYKFSVSSLLTMAICILSYILLVRWSPIGWLLNGKRKSLLRRAPVASEV